MPTLKLFADVSSAVAYLDQILAYLSQKKGNKMMDIFIRPKLIFMKLENNPLIAGRLTSYIDNEFE